MKYAIIIPCFNEADALQITLKSIFEAIRGRRDVEILLMDNGSSDGSQECAEAFGVDVYETPGVKISTLRNMGAHRSTARYFLFLDADIKVPENWLTSLDFYTDSNNAAYVADVVGFVDTVPPHAPWFARIWGLRAGAKRSEVMPVDSLPGRNIFVDRRWFELVGGFSETLITGEDKDFVLRLKKAGAKVVSDPRLDVLHLGYEKTFWEWVRKEYWRQHSHIGLIRNNGLSLRLLRFPLISVFHLPLSLCALVLISLDKPSQAMGVISISLLPSFLLSVKHRVSRSSLSRLIQFTLLYWLRFHVAGISVLVELVRLKKT